VSRVLEIKSWKIHLLIIGGTFLWASLAIKDLKYLSPKDSIGDEMDDQKSKRE
jgi:hypothetical protein